MIERDQGSTTIVPATDLYARLPEIDFSRHMAQGHESDLSVLRVPPCGWSAVNNRGLPAIDVGPRSTIRFDAKQIATWVFDE